MEVANFLTYIYLLFVLCGLQVTALGRNLLGFKGEAINFTWSFSNHSVRRIYFGLWDKDSVVVEYSILTVEVQNNGKISIHPISGEIKVLPYLGRVKWVGDVSKRVASFQLSNIEDYDDGKDYGMEVEFKDDTYDYEGNWTHLIVKPPSMFTFGPNSISAERGDYANFTWTYSLYDGDRKSLTSILFGVYRQSSFQELCNAKVFNEMVKKSSCQFGRANIKMLEPISRVSFVLTQINLSDEAVYEVRLGGTLRALKNKAKLIVNDKPKIILQPNSKVISENHKLNLTCAASGKPAPIMTWFKDGQTVQSSNRNDYVVYQTKIEDAGTYECVASNIAGNDKSVSVTVDVNYAPRINASSAVILKHVPIGKSRWLKCPTSAKPPANIKWFCNGKLNENDGENIQVIISTVQDYKNYTCIASNSIGADNVTFVLKQVGPPSVPIVACENRGTFNSRTYKLHWNTPSDDGGEPVQSYMVKYRTLSGHRKTGPWKNVNVSSTETWCKVELNWKTVYEFTVTAWNIYGESKLDPDRLRSCVVVIKRDPSQKTTTVATPKQVVAAAKDDTGGKSSIHVAVYIGPVIGVLVIIILIALVVTRRRRSRKSRAKTNWQDQHVSFNALGNVFEPPTCNDKLLTRGQQTMVGSPCYQMDPDWTIPREKICILKVIGNGAFGLVYKGRAHGIGSDNVGWSIVAIKSPYADATESEVRDLMKEFELLKTLKPHPHVIKLLGCGEGEGRPLVIIEYVPFGDLLGYLRKSRGEDDDYYSDPEIKPNTNLSSQQLLRFGWNIADGMAYLASEKIIHRDLAARNVLVGEGLACKITDFGMAKDVSNDDIYVRTTEGRLPVKWTAMEALTGSGEYTTQSDVWSFGVVMYEICTIGSDPYPGIAGKELPDQIERGYRMPRPNHVDTLLYDIMLRCWNKYPEERPTFPELKETLMTLENANSKDYINLAECLYQNIAIDNSKGAGGGDPIRRTNSAKENDYHKGPHIPPNIPAV